MTRPPEGVSPNLFDSSVVCANKSTTSLLVISTGKRLVADAIIENATANSSGLFMKGTSDGVVVTNLREVFSMTIARISWKLQNLSEVFGAHCDVEDGCLGLHASLFGANQQLIVGVDALPVSQVASLKVVSAVQVVPHQPLPIVAVNRPQNVRYVKNIGLAEQRWLGEILHPHNVKNLNGVDMKRQITACAIGVENRVHTVVNNHLYIKNSLQTAYTTAAFFLFQNGVARDIVSETSRQSVLAFDQNSQQMSVRLSIPHLNALLTIVGCVLLVGVLLAALLWSHLVVQPAQDHLGHITEPHVVARVLLDDTTFPSLLLHRRVTTGNMDEPSDAEAFCIDEISFRRRDHELLPCER